MMCLKIDLCILGKLKKRGCNLNMSLLNVYARSRDKEAFSGKAKSVTSNNKKGVFDILPRHANFISLIYDFVSIIKENGEVLKINLTGQSVMRVYEDKVDIFLGLEGKNKP